MKQSLLIVGIVILVVVIIVGIYVFLPPGQPLTDKEEACINSGGTVRTQSCCKSVSDFPNLCLIGACGCSLENSHEVRVCDCGEGKCWNSGQNKCI